MIIIQTN